MIQTALEIIEEYPVDFIEKISEIRGPFKNDFGEDYYTVETFQNGYNFEEYVESFSKCYEKAYTNFRNGEHLGWRYEYVMNNATGGVFLRFIKDGLYFEICLDYV